MDDVPGWVQRLPMVNASLNALATVLLLTGHYFIRAGSVAAHKRFMLSAFVVSSAFLSCYVIYHSYVHFSKPFAVHGPIRTVYYTILVSHIVLAATVPFLALVTIFRALAGQWERHRRIARITFPIWLYVSVTGVIIYGMLYHLVPWLAS